jgi:hypothetical protein
MLIQYVGIALGLTMAVLSVARGQALLSAAPAEKLARLLAERKMPYIAAVDPSEEGRYVSAMLVGDAQIFLVSARYSQPSLLDERLKRRDYEGAYAELNSASIKEGRWFVQDLGAPGLRPSREADGPFDIVYASDTKRTAFDGNWQAQGLSQESYLSAYQEADKRYAQALETLLAALEKSGGPGSTAPPFERIAPLTYSLPSS